MTAFVCSAVQSILIVYKGIWLPESILIPIVRHMYAEYMAVAVATVNYVEIASAVYTHLGSRDDLHMRQYKHARGRAQNECEHLLA